jgi:hypothetical protein
VIPAELAFGAIDAVTHVKLSGNRNPDLSWSGCRLARSRSPSCATTRRALERRRRQQGGQESAGVAAARGLLPLGAGRPSSRSPPIERGEFSTGVTARGKPGPHAPRDARQGINDYTGWFAGDKDMAGNYFGYDGPCPPWNDEIAHRYVFTLYALDVPRLACRGSSRAAMLAKPWPGTSLPKLRSPAATPSIRP